MADIVNLRVVRKRKARTGKDDQAERNRLLHGRSSAEREKVRAENEDRLRRLEGHRRDDKGHGNAE